MSGHSRLSTFASRVAWRAFTVGIVVGASIAVALLRYWLGQNWAPSFAWELSIGVLLGGVVGWVIPEFINEIRSQWQTSKPLRAMMGPFADNSRPTIIFMASLYPKGITEFEKAVPQDLEQRLLVQPHHGIPWVLTEGDALALGYVMGVLAKAGRRENTSIARDDAGIDIGDSNVICIGSPKSNHQARRINDSFKSIPLRFFWEDGRSTLRTDDGSETWCADETYDFGILVKAPSDYGKEQAVMLIAGISYVGTAGVAYYLWRQWRLLADMVGDQPFGLVLRVRRDNYQYAEPIWTTMGAQR